MAPMLAAIRAEIPQAEIYFHHGETTGIVSFETEVMGAASKYSRSAAACEIPGRF